MSACCEEPAHLCRFPVELIIHILRFLSAPQLTSCRRVCRRWRDVVDDMARDDVLWRQYCSTDFASIYQVVKRKCAADMLWFDVYRALALWARLSEAEESRDEAWHSCAMVEQVEDVYLVKEALIALHRRVGISYWDAMTLQPRERPPVAGVYVRFVEFDDILIALAENLHFRVIRNWKPESLARKSAADDQLHARNIKHFRVFGRKLYFVNIDDDIFFCDLNQKLKAEPLPHNHTDTVLTLSLYDGVPHILTAERHVYILDKDRLVRHFNMESKKDNLFHCAWEYNFIENLDWRIFYFWVANFRVKLPPSPLSYVCLVKVYGDIFFIGCKNGVFLIYYKPFTDGRLDLFNHEPVKEYNFGEREDIPVLSLHPIISIDILEMKDGHRVFVGMPKKVIILTFKHNFEVIKSKAVMPYTPPGPVVLKDNKA